MTVFRSASAKARKVPATGAVLVIGFGAAGVPAVARLLLVAIQPNRPRIWPATELVPVTAAPLPMAAASMSRRSSTIFFVFRRAISDLRPYLRTVSAVLDTLTVSWKICVRLLYCDGWVCDE